MDRRSSRMVTVRSTDVAAGDVLASFPVARTSRANAGSSGCCAVEVRAVRHIGNRVVVSGRAVQRGIRVGLIHLADSEWLDVVR